jgi:cysteinyl-tRNA synthetase
LVRRQPLPSSLPLRPPPPKLPSQVRRPSQPVQSRQREATWLGPGGILALKLAASILAGVTVTMVLWRGDPHAVQKPGRHLVGDASGRAETTIYGGVPRERSARGWEAETTESDRAPPSNWPLPVKTVKFMAPPRDATGSISPTGAVPRSVALPFPSIRPAAVKSWRYQLQNIKPDEIANSSADLVVADYSSDDRPFSKAEVERMKQKPDGSRRIVLSYMSIGEAEDYRWYWSQRGSWLGAQNSKWRGNYAVRFWDPAWQEVIFSYTEKIIAAGFDGVYLDKVDEFETMGHRDDMVQFVTRIATRAKSSKPDFLVISQNGDQLLSDSKFRRAIDGFACEDLFYGEDSDGARNSAASIRERLTRLKMLAAEGKPVFVVEYLRNEAQAQTARREISEQGFVGLIARRSLSAL